MEGSYSGRQQLQMVTVVFPSQQAFHLVVPLGTTLPKS
jgi:hypothetical protein